MTLRYSDEICHLASMHQKEKAIAPPFAKFLGCKVIPGRINTDVFGTFTNEFERKFPPFICAKKKCFKVIDVEKGNLGIASEGSFAPHPSVPFVSADFELLFFTDLKLGFELTISKVSMNTNFDAKSIGSIEELSGFAKKTLFPSHALILRPNDTQDPHLISKGIQSFEKLCRIFQIYSEVSRDRMVRVETDMRAHMNPTRMKIIEELAYEMAQRLTTPCPSCQIPGWGIVNTIPGLPCKECQIPTHLVKLKIYGCCQCNHQEILENRPKLADPAFCPCCNP